MNARLDSRSRVAIVASILEMTGCAGLFGYEYPVTHCNINSDCPESLICAFGKCSPQCVEATRDCQPTQTCSAEHVCVDPEVVTASDGPDAHAQDACVTGAAAPDGAIDFTSDPNNCGQCAAACPSGVCADSLCREVMQTEYYVSSAAPQIASIHVPNDVPVSDGSDASAAELAGVLINVPRPGWLVGLGMMTFYGGATGYLALYTNANGPGRRIAVTDEFVVAGAESMGTSFSDPQNTNVSLSSIPIAAGDYWILGIWQSEVFLVPASGNATSCSIDCASWYRLPMAFGPPPDPAPPDGYTPPPAHPAPVLYANVAE